MKNLMIQGTTSSAGKSLFCAALCRILSKQGFKVFPFKSQNMSSRFVCIDGGIISSAQVLQAFAAGKKPSVDMNPILLVPNSDTGSKVFVRGKKLRHMSATEYFDYKKNQKQMLEKIYKKISAENDIVIIEGAGSPAEINLNQHDIVNMGMAKIADAPVLLIGDIDRGGIFAHFYGTVKLLAPEEQKRVKGLIINKFRGDKKLLDSGIKIIEDMLGIPVVGTIPYLELNLPEEDSLSDKKTPSLSLEKNNTLSLELDKLAQAVIETCDIDFIKNLIFCN